MAAAEATVDVEAAPVGFVVDTEDLKGLEEGGERDLKRRGF